MKSTKKWTWIILGGLAVIALAVGAGSAFAQASDSDTQATLAFPPFPPRAGVHAGSADHLSYLADALGITVDELQAAMQEAHQAGIAQAVEDGQITQEQADLMLAMGALRDYIDRDALIAEALGITPEALQQARADGKSMATLLEEFGLTTDTFQEAMQSTREAAIQQAVDDGVITQELADQILSGEWGPFGARGSGPCGSGGPGFGPRGFGKPGFGPRGFGDPANGFGSGRGPGG